MLEYFSSWSDFIYTVSFKRNMFGLRESLGAQLAGSNFPVVLNILHTPLFMEWQ
jgi:hypothetical protein